MRATNFRRCRKNTLIGFFDLVLPSGLILRGCALHLSHGRHWVGLPAKPYTDASGAATWAAVVDFSDQATRARFQRQALRAALAAAGDEAAA